MRAVAVAALGRLQAVEALPAILRLHDDTSALVRQNLAAALGLLGASTPAAVNRPQTLTVSVRGARLKLWLTVWRWWKRRHKTRDQLQAIVDCLRGELLDVSPSVRVQAAESVAQDGSRRRDRCSGVARRVARHR